MQVIAIIKDKFDLFKCLWNRYLQKKVSVTHMNRLIFGISAY